VGVGLKALSNENKEVSNDCKTYSDDVCYIMVLQRANSSFYLFIIVTDLNCIHIFRLLTFAIIRDWG